MFWTRIFYRSDWRQEYRQRQISGAKPGWSQTGFYAGDTVAIALSNISQEYFTFMQVRKDARFSFAEFLGELANYPTNINGGLGFLISTFPMFVFCVLNRLLNQFVRFGV